MGGQWGAPLAYVLTADSSRYSLCVALVCPRPKKSCRCSATDRSPRLGVCMEVSSSILARTGELPTRRLLQKGNHPCFIVWKEHLLPETAPLGRVQIVLLSLSYLETNFPWGSWWASPFSPSYATTLPWGSLFNLCCPAQGQPCPRWCGAWRDAWMQRHGDCPVE